MTEFGSIDAFNLPIGVVGQHPGEFYGAIGRVVCVCAVLEDQVTTLRHTLARARQGQFMHQAVKAQIDAARTLALRLPQPAAVTITVFLDEVAEACAQLDTVAPGQLRGVPSRCPEPTGGAKTPVLIAADECIRADAPPRGARMVA